MFNNKLYYGACVYPEVWSDEVMIEDYNHMKQIGMNLARLGEFGWSTFEPTPNEFDFSILERSLELTKERGIDVVICTPTPTPPIWFTHNHPERLHVDEVGNKMIHGSRQHVCTNNPYFRERANIIVDKMMEIIKNYDHVIAVQLDNEFKCHVGQCYCENCKGLWQVWLKNKYKTINHLNEAWGTKVWSQEFHDFDQVVQPLNTPFLHNSSLLLNYKRFHHEKLAEFVKEQVSVVKKHTDLPVTHNAGMFFDVDFEMLGEELDFMSFDTYTTIENYENYVLNQERWRYIKNESRQTMLLETSTSQAGHIENYITLHESGYVEAEAFVNFAAGTSAFTFWPFRGQSSGSEQPHGSVVSSWGDKTIGYDSVLDVSKLIDKITPAIKKSEIIEPHVAITYSDRARSYIDNENGGVYNYKELMNAFHKHFLDINVHRKLVPENHDLEKVDVLFSPYMHHLSEDYTNRALDFVRKGGTWFVGPMSSDRTDEHRWPTDNGLGILGEILSLDSVVQFYSKDGHTTGEAFGITTELNGLNTFIEGENHTSLGKVTSDIAKDKTFLLEKEIGDGNIVYLGAHVNEELLRKIIKHYTNEHRIDEIIETSDEIVIFNRKELNSDRIQYWMVNLSKEDKYFTVNKELYNILDEKLIRKGKYTLEPYGYLVVTED